MSTPNPSSRPRLALIAGPTASGKSALALELAERESGTVINADASQVYRELRIVTARPTPADEARVPHLLYGNRDGSQPCSAAAWAEDAGRAVREVSAAGRLPILVGGTGLYLRTLLDGIAPVPEIDPAIRHNVRLMEREPLREALTREDPEVAERLHPHDTGRMQRALEVVRSSGQSILRWREVRSGGIRGNYALDVRIVDPSVTELYSACDARVLAMIDQGGVEEVADLLRRDLSPDAPIMQAIGVRELAAFLRGQDDLPNAVAKMQQHTRRYGKRQRTWFRHQPLDGLHGNNRG